MPSAELVTGNVVEPIYSSPIGGCGYTCSCGVAHSCAPGLTWWVNPYPVAYYPWVMFPAIPTVQRFRGARKTLGDLPRPGVCPDYVQAGDAYYVEDERVLVVRTANGWYHWYHFDGS